MPPRWILLTLACVLLLAVGQLLFRVAAQQWHVEGWSLATARSFLSPTMHCITPAAHSSAATQPCALP